MLGDATELKGVKVTSGQFVFYMHCSLGAHLTTVFFSFLDTVTRVDRLEEEERRHDASIARSNRDAKKVSRPSSPWLSSIADTFF